MKIYDKKLAYPYFVWMTLFTVVPLLIVVYYAFTDGNGAFTVENLASISGYGSVFARSLLLALIATVICLVLAFPIGYFLSRLRVNKQHIMLMLVMLPMWMNFLLRTYAWMGLLSVNGPVNAILGFFGLGPYTMLNTSGAVVLGMVYNYLPYMVLPLYTIMVKIDNSVIEAAQAMGCTNLQIICHVLLPEAKPSLISGCVISTVTILSYTALAATLGGTGLGQIAIIHGHQRSQKLVVWVCVLLIVVIVQLIQIVGTTVVRKTDKRAR